MRSFYDAATYKSDNKFHDRDCESGVEINQTQMLKMQRIIVVKWKNELWEGVRKISHDK